MCGIGGILRVWTPGQRDLALRTPHGEAIPESWLDVLDESVRHRGPDGRGRFRDRVLRSDGCVVDVAFVHRRLSIIDHLGGRQPMVLEVPKRAPSARSGESSSGPPIPGRLLSVEQVDAHNRRVLADGYATQKADGPGNSPERALGALSGDRIAVVFNGCIYNHRELRAELQAAGHVFGTDHSDTEVLVHGWREWGENLFGRLEAMHAAVIWDAGTGTLALSRDSFGEKPLHLFHARRLGSWVNVFASVPPSEGRIAEAIGPSDELVPSGSRPWHWLRFGFAPNAPVGGAHSVWPGHAFFYAPGVVDAPPARSPLHAPPPTHRRHGVLHPDRIESIQPGEVERLLSEAVRSRVQADVPLGCFLSGGVDSSIVTLMAQRHLGRVRSFTVRMPVASYDESAFAERVAAVIGSDHTTLECSPDPAGDLVHLIQQCGLPLGDSSLLPAYWLCRAAGSHIKVALSGDGGDELFGGYERYAAARWLATGVPGAAAVGRLVGAGAAPKSARAKCARFLEACGGAGYQDLASIFPSAYMDRVLPEGAERSADRAWRRSSPTPLDAAQAMAYDMWNFLPNDLLAKTDVASMSVPLEVRAPFLDRSLVERMLGVRQTLIVPNGQRKGLLRQVARKYFPAEIVDRPKMGFAIPIGEWFRTDYGGLRTMLLDHLNSAEPFGPPSLGIDLNMAFVRQMLDEHLGAGPSGMVKRDHAQRLYMLLVLSIWGKWVGGLRAAT